MIGFVGLLGFLEFIEFVEFVGFVRWNNRVELRNYLISGFLFN